MKVEIEISGDKEFCSDDNEQCAYVDEWNGLCLLASVHDPYTDALDGEDTEDYENARYKKCRWCLETFPVDNA